MNQSIKHYSFIKILKKFSKKEIREFEKFLNSPFYNNQSALVKIFSQLKKFYPDFENEKLTKEYLFSFAGNGKYYNDILFRKYISRLNKLAEEYLNVLHMRSKPHKMDINILEEFSNKDLDDVFKKKLNAVEKSVKNNGLMDADYFHMMFQLSRIRYNQDTNDNYIKSYNEELYNSSNYLLNFFLSEASIINNQIEINNYSFRITPETNPLTAFLKISEIKNYINVLNKNKSSGYKNLNVFLEIIINDINLNSSVNGLAAYYNLKDLVKLNSEKLSKELLSYILQRMNIFCFIENIKGIKNWDKEIFLNFKFLIENNLLNIEGSKLMTLLNFRSILLVALKNKEFSWAGNLIAENLKNIEEEHMTDIRNYGNAVLMFYKKKYKDSLDCSSKIKSTSLPIVIDIYVLKMKIFYVLSYFDSAASVADSFRHFVNRNKLIGEFHKITFYNFLRYYRKILSYRIKNDKKSLLKLKTELKKCSNTRERNWMIEIIEEQYG